MALQKCECTPPVVNYRFQGVLHHGLGGVDYNVTIVQKSMVLS